MYFQTIPTVKCIPTLFTWSHVFQPCVHCYEHSTRHPLFCVFLPCTHWYVYSQTVHTVMCIPTLYILSHVFQPSIHCYIYPTRHPLFVYSYPVHSVTCISTLHTLLNKHNTSNFESVIPLPPSPPFHIFTFCSQCHMYSNLVFTVTYIPPDTHYNMYSHPVHTVTCIPTVHTLLRVFSSCTDIYSDPVHSVT